MQSPSDTETHTVVHPALSLSQNPLAVVFPATPTKMATDSQMPLGLAAVFIATIFFGSNFVPVKRYETYDGMYYQWVMCAAIWMTGLIVQLFLFAWPGEDDKFGAEGLNQTDFDVRLQSGRPDPYSVKFIPMAVLGGALWATGNTLSVPVINYIGLSLGLLIWGSSNMLMGWATGMFGLFTGHAEYDKLHNIKMNCVGVALAVIALAMYTQISTESGAKPTSAEGEPLELDDVLLTPSRVNKPRKGGQLIGILMAVVAGILFGNTFTPPDYIRKNNLGPKNSMDYVFSHFCGIFATSTFWFIVYCAVKKGKPLINPSLTLPGMLSGFMWAIAQTCWFIANSALSVSVAFPMITSGPGIVSALWGVFVFSEIQGRRNHMVLCLAITTALVGCTLIGLSK